MDVQVVVDMLLDEVADILVDGVAIRSHLCGAELDFRLTFKDWFLYVDGNGGNQSRCECQPYSYLHKKLLDGSGNMFLEGTLVSSALCGVLSVHKRVILFAILVGVCKGNLNVFHPSCG